MRPTRRWLVTMASLAAAGLRPARSRGQEAHQRFAPNVVADVGDRLDPWIELGRERYRHNCRAIARRTGGRPVIAVLKNNAYGLGVREVATILDQAPEVWGLALVQAEDALQLRADGISKPILLMARHTHQEGEELARQDVSLSAFGDDDPERFRRLAARLGRPVKAQLYIDTGLGRMGRWHERLAPWIDEIRDSIEIEGAVTMLTSDESFTRVQLQRFAQVRSLLLERGITPGIFHAASSAPALHQPESLLDAVRPGILLHGSLPGGGPEEAALIELRVAFRLRAGIVRVERLPAGATLGFSRFYPIDRPTWIATVPTGWGDGYPSAAENGAVASSADGLLPVVNVNSNHTNLLLGEEPSLNVGDQITLMGWDSPEVTPEGLASRIESHNYRHIDLKSYLPKFIS